MLLEGFDEDEVAGSELKVVLNTPCFKLASKGVLQFEHDKY